MRRRCRNIGLAGHRIIQLVGHGRSPFADRRFAPSLDHRSVGSSASARACRRRSEEHTSELQSLLRISYAVFCFKTQHLTHLSHAALKADQAIALDAPVNLQPTQLITSA